MQLDATASNPADLTEVEKAAIEEQVERLLQTPYFSHSRRFPIFLRYVVQHTLAGQADAVKERTLGIEIFGRSADYDTSSDPIVRVTAAEIRKRIAQYYQEAAHDEEIRVSLPPGSYVPQFHWPQVPQSKFPQAAVGRTESEGVHELPLTVEAVASDPAAVDPGKRLWMVFAIVTLVACVAVGGLFWWRSLQRSAFDVFWDPILKSGDPVLICIADQNQYTAIALRDAADPAHQTVLKENLSAVVMDDLNPVVKIAGVLQAHGTKYSLKGEGSTTLSDLRNGPTVFVGAFDNAWTLRLTKPLRFHFANNPEMTRFWIVDSEAPDRTDWLIDRAKQQATNNYRDYAIVTRFTDSNTGKIAIVVAGVARGGTIAAGEFLIDSAHLAEVANAVRVANGKKNMEFVLSTEIIDGQPGTPKMEAVYFW
ncbi:MAG TPA: hypothetical protein VN310_00375 [Candidatus Dormibacteraeota bacterium]|jgi:hypothetical protein|nr:hypothetical protein [Candidatus Dormibacteraeota bacterium]